MIPITEPYFPDSQDFKKYIDIIWENQWLTNNGPLVKEFESSLSQHLQTNRPLLVTNGTLAIQIAIKALQLKGEVITTPFSYVATTSSIVWEGCTPVFADIDPKTLNIDPKAVKEAVNDNTVGILATHCFGNACDIDSLQLIASAHNIPIIYDAAHCFGTTYKGRSIFEYGDISTCSLHATKIMHSIEGGLIFANKEGLNKKVAALRNFGHKGYEDFSGLGINGKNSEAHAAMGLCVLKSFEPIFKRRKEQFEIYDNLLLGLPISLPKIHEGCEPNRSYYPIIFNSESDCLKAKENLEEQNIFGRRYFYPSLSSLPYVERQITTHSNDIASRILCLPLYHNLKYSDQKMISQILLNTDFE